MAVEMAIWRMTDAGPQQLASSPLESERRLESMLTQDPGMIGNSLLILGRQVQTSHGGRVDLLALDVDGRVHVLEIKRDRTPRDVVAQTLDYGSWVMGLSLEELQQIYLAHHDGDRHLDEAFADHFDSPLPDVVNEEQQFTIVASELDSASDRIVEFLAESYGLPINAVFFRHFNDDGREYLARTWLLDPQQAEVQAARSSRSKQRPWNGQDFYVVLGQADEEELSRWSVARRYGLLNAGHGTWYWKPLRNLKPGHRVFAYVAGAGYVGIGQVTGEMIPARDAKIEVSGQLKPFLLLPELAGWKPGAASEDPEVAEMVVPVEWHGTKSLDEGVWEKGLFASQVTVCKLRDERTIETVEAAFSINEATVQSD